MSKYRKQMAKKSSRRDFSKKADYVNPKNANKLPMRGGYRL